MSILISEKILDKIKKELVVSQKSFLLISAYCKLPLVEFFDSCVGSKKLDKKLVVRFRPEDIINGASDLEIYPYCKKNQWRLYFRMDLHAKTYVFDKLRCIVGSANATESGMSAGKCGNYEMATVCRLGDEDVRELDSLLIGAVEMTDDIYKTMQDTLKRVENQSGSISWPESITSLFHQDYSVLFAEDFPGVDSPEGATDEELLFLNIKSEADKGTIKTEFAKSKCYQWLLQLIRNQEHGEMYFGSITVELHKNLLNEPRPYRKDIKRLLGNLLQWIQYLDMDEVSVDRPNYSQRVRLKQ